MTTCGWLGLFKSLFSYLKGDLLQNIHPQILEKILNQCSVYSNLITESCIQLNCATSSMLSSGAFYSQAFYFLECSVTNEFQLHKKCECKEKTGCLLFVLGNFLGTHSRIELMCFMHWHRQNSSKNWLRGEVLQENCVRSRRFVICSSENFSIFDHQFQNRLLITCKMTS